MRHLLVATDGSEASKDAVEEGLALARELGAKVTFVNVSPPVPGLLGEPYYQHQITKHAAAASAAVDAARARAAELGVECDSEILEGDPAEQILATAKTHDVDLVVVGSRGLGSIAGALLGSVSSRVVHECDRPVLVARNRSPVAIS